VPDHRRARVLLANSVMQYYFLEAVGGSAVHIAEAVEVAFLLASGLSFLQVGLFWTVNLGARTLCDFPAGVMADRLGRRFAYFLGLVMLGVGRVALVAWPHPPVIWLLSAIIGVSGSLRFNPLRSWVVGRVQAEGLDLSTSRVLGTGNALRNATTIAVGILLSSYPPRNLGGVLLFSAAVLLGLTLVGTGWWAAGCFGPFSTARDRSEEEASCSRSEPAVGIQRPKLHIMGALSYLRKADHLTMLTVVLVVYYLQFSAYGFVRQPLLLGSGWSESQLPLTYSWFTAAILLTNLAGGRLLTKRNYFGGLCFGLAANGAAAGLLLLARSRPVTLSPLLSL